MYTHRSCSRTESASKGVRRKRGEAYFHQRPLPTDSGIAPKSRLERCSILFGGNMLPSHCGGSLYALSHLVIPKEGSVHSKGFNAGGGCEEWGTAMAK